MTFRCSKNENVYEDLYCNEQNAQKPLIESVKYDEKMKKGCIWT